MYSILTYIVFSVMMCSDNIALLLCMTFELSSTCVCWLYVHFCYQRTVLGN